MPSSFFCVKVCDFEVVCGPESSILWNFIFVFFSQGEILWYCQRHNCLRLEKAVREKYGNEIKGILSYGLSNNISLCRGLNYSVSLWLQGISFKVTHPCHKVRRGIFHREMQIDRQQGNHSWRKAVICYKSCRKRSLHLQLAMTASGFCWFYGDRLSHKL